MYNKERLGFPNLFFVLKILAKFHAFCSVTYNLVRAFTITRVFSTILFAKPLKLINYLQLQSLKSRKNIGAKALVL